MTIQYLPLTGHKALRAFNSFHTLMLGLKMLPLYSDVDYETFYEQIEEKSEEEKRTLIKQAIRFVPLEKEEVEALLCFAKDKNGIPYTSANIKNLQITEIAEIMCEVCMQIASIRVDMITDEEKKSLETSP